MEKAAKVLRRSGAKLKALNDGGSAELRIAMSETADVRSAARTFSESQSAACRHLVQWSIKQGNPAIQDAAVQMEELNHLLSEAILQYSDSAGCFSEVFARLTEDERHLNRLREKMADTEKKVHRMRAELKKALKKTSSDKVHQLEASLSEAERARGVQQLELAEQTRESDAVKSIRFKQGVHRLSVAGIQFGLKCLSIYEALQEVANQVPDVHDGEPTCLEYSGFAVTRQRVARARREVEQCSLLTADSRSPRRHAPAASGAADSVSCRVSRAEPVEAASSSSRSRRCYESPSSSVPADVPPPYSPGSFDEHWSKAESARRHRSSGRSHHRSSLTGGGARADVTVSLCDAAEAPSFTAVTAASTPRPLAAASKASGGACGSHDATASSSGYFSVIESPASASHSSPAAARSAAMQQPPQLDRPATPLMEQPLPPPPPELLSPELLSPEPDRRGGAGGGCLTAAARKPAGDDGQPLSEQTAVPSPRMEWPVERQALYRSAVASTPLCRQASTSSSSCRRLRMPTAICSPD